MHLLCMHAMWQHKWQAGEADEGQGSKCGACATGHTTARARAGQGKQSSRQAMPPAPPPTRPNVAFPAVAHKKVVKRCRRLWTCV